MKMQQVRRTTHGASPREQHAAGSPYWVARRSPAVFDSLTSPKRLLNHKPGLLKPRHRAAIETRDTIA